jgi:hypothetical protein
MLNNVRNSLGIAEAIEKPHINVRDIGRNRLGSGCALREERDATAFYCSLSSGM